MLATDRMAGGNLGLGDSAKALADYESALKIRPGYAQVLHDRADLKQAQGDQAGARADYELARQAGYQQAPKTSP